MNSSKPSSSTCRDTQGIIWFAIRFSLNKTSIKRSILGTDNCGGVGSVAHGFWGLFRRRQNLEISLITASPKLRHTFDSWCQTRTLNLTLNKVETFTCGKCLSKSPDFSALWSTFWKQKAKKKTLNLASEIPSPLPPSAQNARSNVRNVGGHSTQLAHRKGLFAFRRSQKIKPGSWAAKWFCPREFCGNLSWLNWQFHPKRLSYLSKKDIIEGAKFFLLDSYASYVAERKGK